MSTKKPTITVRTMQVHLQSYHTMLPRNEKEYIDTIKMEFQCIIPGAELMGAPLFLEAQPDLFLRTSAGNYAPVEVKFGTFDQRAVDQLARYMSLYDCLEGYGIAPYVPVHLRPGKGMSLYLWPKRPMRAFLHLPYYHPTLHPQIETEEYPHAVKHQPGHPRVQAELHQPGRPSIATRIKDEYIQEWQSIFCLRGTRPSRPSDGELDSYIRGAFGLSLQQVLSEEIWLND